MQEHGKCPVTQQELTADDLLAAKTNRAVAPRPAAAASFPGLLRCLASEWDGIMVEAYELRQQLDTARQELSHALYQHDAACRVIARLTKERDEARAAAASSSVAVKRAAEEDGAPAAKRAKTGGRLEALMAAIEAKAAELQGWRKKRELPEGTPAADAFAGYDAEKSKPLHKTTTPGVRCLDCGASAEGAQLSLSGGEDGQAVLLDVGAGKIAGTLKGHKGAVTAARLVGGGDQVLTGGADGTVRLWSAKGGKWAQVASADAHEGGVTAISVHPTGEAFLTAGADGTWALFDLASMEEQLRAKCSAVVTSAVFHPDGLLVLAGCADGKLRMVDLKSQGEAAAIDAHGGAVVCVSASENGYHVATAGPEGVRVWDLRKLKQLASLDVGGAGSSVAFDPSGLFLAAAGAGALKVFGAKQKWATLKEWAAEGGVSACAFGPAASFVASGSAGERHVRTRSAA